MYQAHPSLGRTFPEFFSNYYHQCTPEPSVTQPYLKAYLSLLVPQEVVCYILPPGEGVNHERTPAFEIPFSRKFQNHSLFLKEWPSRLAAS